MKFIRWSRYTGEPSDAVDLQELVKRLSDFFLQSGFESQFYGISEMDPERSMEKLREAILRALQEGDLIPDELMQQLLENTDLSKNEQLRELLDQLIERLAQEDISPRSRRRSPLRRRRLLADRSAVSKTLRRKPGLRSRIRR